MRETQWKENLNHLRCKVLVLSYLQVTTFFVTMPVATLDLAAVWVPQERWGEEQGCSEQCHGRAPALPKWGWVVVRRVLKQGTSPCGQERHLGWGGVEGWGEKADNFN